MDKTILKDSQKSVDVLHHGFDIAIVIIDGKQQCINVNETTLTRRQRPKRPK